MRLLPAIAVACVSLALAACSGTIEDGGDGSGVDAGPGGGGGGPEPMPGQTVDITGPAVLPHVQLFANAMCSATGACEVGTRVGHSPSAERAIDILTSDVYGKRPTDDNALGDAVAEFTLAHMEQYGVTYLIWRQRYNDGSGWDPMDDRGSITANHYDHVHVSFDATAP